MMGSLHSKSFYDGLNQPRFYDAYNSNLQQQALLDQTNAANCLNNAVLFGSAYVRPGWIYDSPSRSEGPKETDPLKEYNDYYYAPKGINHKKTFGTRIALVYSRVMVKFGNWLIRISE